MQYQSSCMSMTRKPEGAEMWFYKIILTRCSPNDRILSKIGTKILLRIKWNNLTFLGHIIKKAGLENVTFTGYIKGKAGSRRQLATYRTNLCNRWQNEVLWYLARKRRLLRRTSTSGMCNWSFVTVTVGSSTHRIEYVIILQ